MINQNNYKLWKNTLKITEEFLAEIEPLSKDFNDKLIINPAKLLVNKIKEKDFILFENLDYIENLEEYDYDIFLSYLSI